MAIELITQFLDGVYSARSRHITGYAAPPQSVFAPLFRGQASRHWGLRPSALRDGERGITTSERLQDWKRFAAPFVQHWPTTEIEWLALAQHHGVRTVLLDWTLNPLIALYFACQFAHRDGTEEPDGCVWMIESGSIQEYSHTMFVDPFKLETKRAVRVSVLGVNPRARSQHGVMTMFPANSGDFTGDGVSRIFEISANDKPQALMGLRALGITDSFVYGDLDSVGKEFSNYIRNLG